MKSRNLLLVAVTTALAGWLPAADAQKHVVLENVTAASGQEEVGGKAAIPVTGNARVDPDGNIIVTCASTAPDECPGVGVGSGGLTNVPGITFNGPASGTPVAASDTTARLHWTVSNAHACYALSSTPTVSGWAGPLATSTNANNGFQVGNLTRDAENPTSYAFTLRCYSNTGTDIGGVDALAYADKTHTVTLAQSATGGGGEAGTCESYLAGMTPSERAHFDAYRADNRGFTRVTKAFADQTGRTLGKDAGNYGPPATPMLPGRLTDNEYLALSFVMQPAGGGHTGKFAATFQGVTATGNILVHPIIATISPCPGDFRPRDIGLSPEDPYLRGYCGTVYGLSSSVRGITVGESRCPTPAGQTMYMNFTLRNLYTDPENSIPADGCGTQFCGLGGYTSN